MGGLGGWFGWVVGGVGWGGVGCIYIAVAAKQGDIVQELCENQGGRRGLSVLTSLLVSVDVKLY